MSRLWVVPILAVFCLMTGSIPAAAQQQTPSEICEREYRNGAVDVCREAAEAAPEDLELKRYLAIAYQITGAYEPSLQLYAELARVQPENPEAQYEYAYAASFMRRYGESVAPIESAIRLQPRNVRHYKLASIIYAVLRRFDDRFRVTIRAAEMGDQISMFEVSHYFARGEGTEQSDEQALRWMKEAANAGHVAAMDEMALIYLNGRWGQEPDERLAEQWATRALRARGKND